MTNPKYSICITHYNDALTIAESIESVLSQIDDKFEVIVVDSFSNDGSYEILQRYTHSIHLFQKKCSRGEGRQFAFEKSSGDYIISNMDMDEVFAPVLPSVLSLYHKTCEGKLLRIARPTNEWHAGSISIMPRSLVVQLGGWRDLQNSEDVDMYSKAAKEGKYVWANFKLVAQVAKNQERRKRPMRLLHRYFAYRDDIRIGRPVHPDWKKFLIYVAARIGAALKPNFRDDFNVAFRPFEDESYRIELKAD